MSLEKIKIKKLNDNATIPTRSHSTDAGLDLYASRDVIVTTGTLVPTDIAVDIPPGYEGQIRPRSGKTSNTKLRVQIGTVDSGYTGELKVITDVTDSIELDEGSGAITKIALRVQKGEKIAQLVISPIETPLVEVVDEFESESERGENGFGSTGK